MYERWTDFNDQFAEDEDERAERWRKLKADRRRRGLNPDGSAKKPDPEQPGSRGGAQAADPSGRTVDRSSGMMRAPTWPPTPRCRA